MVSGLFHSPRRGAFHLSLTVLVHYRSSAVFSLGPWSAPLPARFRVSGGTHASRASARPARRLRGSHPLRRPVPAAFGCAVRSGRALGRALPLLRPTPIRHRRPPVPPDRFGLFPVRSPLLGESFLFLAVLRCFSSRGARRTATVRRPAKRRAGCPIRRSRARWLPAPPPGISPRGRVLPRPPTPRHPPCAHHRGRASPDPRRRHPTPARFARPGPRPSSHGTTARSHHAPTCRSCRLVAWRRRGGRVVLGDDASPIVKVRHEPRRRAGGAAGSRTPDLRRAKAALSRLSYGPQGRWARLDSNQGPRPYQGRALTA
jgi:hypothetical protein